MDIFFLFDRLVLSVFGLLFIIDYTRHRKQINIYIKHGLLLGVLITAPFILIIIMVPIYYNWDIEMVHLLTIGYVLIIGLLIAMLTCIGMYYCNEIHYKDIPIIRSWLSKNKKLRTSIDKDYVFDTLIISFGGLLFSIVLIELTFFDYQKYLTDYRMVFMAIIMGLYAAVLEEIFYRMCIQNYIANIIGVQNGRYWLSIILTSLFWSLAHLDGSSISWFRLVQLFPGGIALGYLFKKHGLESTIIAHSIINLGIIFVYQSTGYMLTI